MVASIPNIRHKSVLKKLIFSDSFEYKDRGILDITHIRFFTETSIRKMFDDCGYEILKIEKIDKPSHRAFKRFKETIKEFLIPKRFISINTVQFGVAVKAKERQA